jgi:arylsulfatase
MHKTWVHEGGACTPLVAHWPKGITGKGRISDRVGHVIDLVPTVLDLAGLPADKKTGPAYPGTSLAPVLKGKEQAQPRDLWWAHDGHRAYRSGDWKIVSKKGKGWELYDLGEDRTERKDLAGSKKEKVKQLADKWEKTVDGFVEDLKN